MCMHHCISCACIDGCTCVWRDFLSRAIQVFQCVSNGDAHAANFLRSSPTSLGRAQRTNFLASFVRPARLGCQRVQQLGAM
jgi:hypothetical protein